MVRIAFAAALLLGCAASHAPRATPHAPAPRAAVAPPVLTDADVIARAHAFFDTVDRHDAAAFRAMLAPGFALFEDGRVNPGAKMAKTWDKRVKQGLPPRTRSCTKERVRRNASTAVYIGDCKEKVPAFNKRKAAVWDGWNTVVLTRDGGTWKVALWQWQRSGMALERLRWNYAFSRGTGFTKKPNQLLVDTVARVRPGKALVLAMGQGRNALQLAELGWQVTGLDLSTEGVRIARREAARRKLKLDARVQDINKYRFGKNRWDLVTMLYWYNVSWIKRLQPSVKRGGLVVIEHFLGTRGDAGFTKDKLAKLFAGWDIVENQVVEDYADWTQRKTKLIRFVAKKR